MAYQQADADNLRAAILALVTGQRVVTVKYAGPPAREITYQEANLKDMQAALAVIDASLTGPQRHRYVSFNKGFRSGGGRRWRTNDDE